jgi:hypothetical protein
MKWSFDMNKTKWFGIVRWCADDVAAKLEEMGIPTTQDNIDTVVCACENNHHFTDTMIEAGWYMIEEVIDQTLCRGE